MTKKEEKIIKMAAFIQNQALTLLEKIEEIDLDEEANDCEKLHDLAEALAKKLEEKLS